MAVNTVLSDDAFQNAYSRGLFEAIDELRKCGANRDLELPELVIVGDQSAGKSSLLQSLTDIPFPVAGRLCTRFPTRIISRRALNDEDIIKISIETSFANQFGGEDWGMRQQQYAEFTRTTRTFTAAEFKRIVEEATDAMGVRRTRSSEVPATATSDAAKRNFSEDVLKVEISGPNRSYFSILDVPGVFQSVVKDVTKEEKDGVKDMVARFMRPKTSVIICVASGTNDLANQAAFDMASQEDPEGDRTVGVITKCDVAQDLGQVIELAKNKEKTLQHGWFVVRNRTPSEVNAEISPLERHNLEHGFFENAPWTALPESRRGTQNLKKYLADLLCSRIQKSFPALVEQIWSYRQHTSAALVYLGDGRATPEQRRAYLTKIASEFHSFASQSLRGRYDSTSNEDTKLRMKAREANDAFALEMKMHGHAVPFVGQLVLGKGRKDQATASIKDLPAEVRAHATLQPHSFNGNLFPNSSPGEVGPPWHQTESTTFTPHSLGMDGRSLQLGQSLTFMNEFREQSFEELRLRHYVQGKQASTTSVFGGAKYGDLTANKPFGPGIFAPPPKSAVSYFPNAESGNTRPNQHSDSRIFGPKAVSDFGSAPDSFKKFDFLSNHPSDDIYSRIRVELKACRGTELQGTLNPDVLPTLFHKQARKWKAISESYFDNVAKMTCDTMMKILDAVCTDKDAKEKIKSSVRQSNQEGKARHKARLSSHIDHILSRHLQTNNPAFEKKISEARKRRFQAALERYRLSRSSSFDMPSLKDTPTDKSAHDEKLVIDMRDTATLFEVLHISSSQNLEHEIHDTLQAYYEIARDDFVEYVNQLIVEHYLHDSNGPVLFFSPIYVGGLSDDEVHYFAAENEATVQKRIETLKMLTRLDQAAEIASKYTQ